ncbi:MAG: SDR family NAD(P)-dependent oxidoreductase [Rhizobiaceae bacterium]
MAKLTPRPHTILITGATDGIGLQLAKDYAARGHKVLATGRRSLITDEDFFGVPNITYTRADQARPQQAAENIANAMRELGWAQLDLAILNAGIGWVGDPSDEKPSEIAQQVTINLVAPIYITKALAPWLAAGKGKLALIGSTAIKGQGNFATYAATKAGLDGFARSLREEWRGKADVLMIHPGPIRTDMHAKAGLNIGAGRALFMSPKRASRAIQKAIRNNDKRRILSRSYGWRTLFAGGKEGRL